MSEQHRIQRVQTFIARVPSTQPVAEPAAEQRIYPMPERTPAPPAQITSLIVRLETASGIVGWGEAAGPDSRISRAVIDEQLAPVIMGSAPFSIGVLWEQMRTRTGGRYLDAMGAVDMALWDIAGQIAGVPACRLMGGQVRDRVPVVATDLPYTAGDTQAVEQIKTLLEAGYRTVRIRLNAPAHYDENMLRPLETAAGDTGALVISVTGADDLALARQIGMQAQEYGAKWFENPLNADNLRDASRLAAFLDIPLAGGRGLQGRWQFNAALAASAFDIAHVDVGHAGGISEALRIIILADTYGLPFVTTSVPGTAISQAAALQVAAAGLNLMACEWPLPGWSGDGILHEPFTFADGAVSISDRPGLGIEIDEAVLMQWCKESA